MSSLIVDVCAVEEIAAHPNADRIERVRVKNWWCIAAKGQYKVGDKVVYVPPDAVISEKLADHWGIKKYCSRVSEPCLFGVHAPRYRVRACRFRGVSSFGTIQDLDHPDWSIGTDLREHLGITKYEPPFKAHDGDAEPPLAIFHGYTSIEALGNFPNVFHENEEVIVTEKLHGTNSRIGLVRLFDDEDWEWLLTAGSHNTRRKEYDDKGNLSKYWLPHYIGKDLNPRPMIGMLFDILNQEKAQSSVIVFGELFGVGVQDLTYGQTGISYRIFDVAVDGNYLDFDKVQEYVQPYLEDGLELVPILYRGPYSLAKMDELVDGPTTICDAANIKTAFKGREGIVIKSVSERFDPIKGGRAILKYISADYHERKDGTEYH